MISSAAEYEMLDTRGLGRFIKGKILPERHGGARRAIRYEDLLYLKEGKLERQNWKWPNGTPPAKVSPPGRLLKRSVFKDAVCAMSEPGEYGGEYRDKDKVIPVTLPVYDENNEARDLDGFIGEKVWLESINAGKRLKLETLEKAYENMRKLKRTFDYGGFDNGTGNYVLRRRVKIRDNDTGGIETFPEEDWIWGQYIYISGIEIRYTNPEGMGDHSPYINQTVAETRTWGGGLATWVNEQYPYATRAWLIGMTTTYVQVEGNSEGYSDWHAIGCSVEREEGARQATVKLQMYTDEFAKSVLESHGGEYVIEPNFNMKSQSVRFYPNGLLVEHEFPAT